MIIVMQHTASAADLAAVVDKIRQAGLSEHVSRGAERTIVGAIGDERALSPAQFELIDRKSTRLNSSHLKLSRMPSSA